MNIETEIALFLRDHDKMVVAETLERVRERIGGMIRECPHCIERGRPSVDCHIVLQNEILTKLLTILTESDKTNGF